jgi:hypothetical protein
MSRYVVVITPEAQGGDGSAGEAQATIRVETAPPTPRIIEMTVRYSAIDGLPATALPSVDLEAVVRALVSGVRATSGSTPTPENEGGHGDPQDAAGGSKPTPAVELEAPSRTRPPETVTEVAGRAYRRMPDADELRAVYERIGTVTGVAEHYGVPRHTAQGWMGRLRKQTN